MNPQIFNMVWEGSDISDEVLEKIKPGIYISGLTYPQFLQIEKKIESKLGKVRILFTGSGYGFVSNE